jgi:hypothetical protein
VWQLKKGSLELGGGICLSDGGELGIFWCVLVVSSWDGGDKSRSSLLHEIQEDNVLPDTLRSPLGSLFFPLYPDLQSPFAWDWRRIQILWNSDSLVQDQNSHLGSRQADCCLVFRSHALRLKCCVCSRHFNGFLERSGIQPTGFIFNTGQKKSHFRRV